MDCDFGSAAKHGDLPINPVLSSAYVERLIMVLTKCRSLVEHELTFRPDEAREGGVRLRAEIDEMLGGSLLFSHAILIPRSPGIRQQIECAAERAGSIQAGMIEKLAAAFLKETSLTPSECELVEEARGSQIVWYFRKKGT